MVERQSCHKAYGGGPQPGLSTASFSSGRAIDAKVELDSKKRLRIRSASRWSAKLVVGATGIHKRARKQNSWDAVGVTSSPRTVTGSPTRVLRIKPVNSGVTNSTHSSGGRIVFPRVCPNACNGSERRTQRHAFGYSLPPTNGLSSATSCNIPVQRTDIPCW